MLTRKFQSIGTVVREWHRRARSRRELAMLGPVDRQDLDYRFDVNLEMCKPFWQA